MSELDEIRRRVRNIWGAISSNQIEDKDVEGQAKRLLDYIDELRRAPSTSPAPGVVELAAKAMCADDGFKWDAKDFGETANGEDPEDQREYWRRKARVCIASLSQPTKGEREGGGA